MPFGPDLRDQLPQIDELTQQLTSFLHDAREFAKERAAIEKETATKLETLARKYMTKGPGGQEESTLSKAWISIIAEVDKNSKTRHLLADKMITDIADPLKVLGQKKEEARRKHVWFAARLLEERNKIYYEKDKAKAAYHETCDAVDAAKQKYEKAGDDKSQEKLKKQWQQDILEMHNAKNNYIISIQVANALKKRFYYNDMSVIQDHLQELDENQEQIFKEIALVYNELDKETLKSCSIVSDETKAVLEAIDPHQDMEAFVARIRKDWVEPYDYNFEPCLLWKDSGSLVTDDYSKIYLANLMSKSKSTLEDHIKEIEARQKELDGLSKLIDAYKGNPSLGDAAEVHENWLESNRYLMIQEIAKTKAESQISTIAEGLGGDALSGIAHVFHKSSFTIPTTCDYCSEKIWGLSRQGFTCKECGYNCHNKCELKVPQSCTQTKGGGRSQRGTVAPNLANIQTSYGATETHRPISGPVLIGSVNSIASQKASSAPRPPVTTVSTCTALYNYTPQTDDELLMNAGDILKVVEGDDGTGWIKVSLNDRTGLVPASYVTNDRRNSFTAGISKLGISSMNQTPVTVQNYRALYDYEGQKEGELSMKVGDLITVSSRDEDGWWEGTLAGRFGQFPASYVGPA